MNIIIGLCVIVLTLAITLLLYAVYNTLKLARRTMEEATLTLVEIRSEVKQISTDAKDIVQQTVVVTADVREKLTDLDALFQSVNNIGQVAQSLTTTVKDATVGAVSVAKPINQTQTKSVKRKEENGIVNAIADGVVSSLRIWSRLRQN